MMKFTLFIFLNTISSCVMDSYDDRLKIVNKSDHTIMHVWEMQNPSDSIVLMQLNYMDEIIGFILPGDSMRWTITNMKYDDIIESEPDKVFRLYIFDADTMRKY